MKQKKLRVLVLTAVFFGLFVEIIIVRANKQWKWNNSNASLFEWRLVCFCLFFSFLVEPKSKLIIY